MRRRARLDRQMVGYAFIAPWLIALVVFIGYPFVASLYFSFCDFPPMRSPLFIGTENYQELAGDPLFHRSLGVTLIFASVAIPLGILFALSLSMLLNTRIRGQSIYRVVFFLPQLVPTVVVAILWLWLFNPEFGLLNVVLRILLSSVDTWTSVFFDLRAAQGGEWFFRPAAAVLLLGPATWLLTRMPALAQSLGDRHRLLHHLQAMGTALFVIAALTALYALLNYLAPADMRKLHNPGWLSDGDPMPSAIPFAPSWALWALVIMSVWGVGQMAVIYLAKLQDIPWELYEAADLDGANWWQKTWHVTVPMMSPVILFNAVMAIIGTFQVFTEPYIMTGGGPEDKTRFVAMFIYEQAFQYQRVGYASAVAWVLFVLIVVLTWLVFRLSRRHVFYQGR